MTGCTCPSFLRVASWIGGDRDGNPHVTHDVTAHAVERQAALALGHYLAEIHALGAELSLSSRYTEVSDELAALAARAPDRGRSRDEELFRRALVGIYARVAATARRLGVEVGHVGPASGPAPAYPTPDDLRANLDVVHTSLAGRRRAPGGRGTPAAPAPRRGAVRVPPRPARICARTAASTGGW